MKFSFKNIYKFFSLLIILNICYFSYSPEAFSQEMMTDRQKLERLQEIIEEIGTEEDDPRVRALIGRYRSVALRVIAKRLAIEDEKQKLMQMSEQELVRYLRRNGIDFPDFDLNGDMFTQVKDELEKVMQKARREFRRR